MQHLVSPKWVCNAASPLQTGRVLLLMCLAVCELRFDKHSVACDLSLSIAKIFVESKGGKTMLNRANGRQQLNFVNKLIRAISDELPQQSALEGDDATSENRLPDEMKEALQQLRLRKLLISAIVDSDPVSSKATRH